MIEQTVSIVSSEEDTDHERRTNTSSQKGRKNIRHIKDVEDLKLETRIANKQEKERIARLEIREQKFREILFSKEQENELILDYDFINGKPLVSVCKELVLQMKKHQKKGVKFMWDSCYESLTQIKLSDGSGCIIAHCMGLGKTFQVISLVHTVLSHSTTGTKTVLICCPKNTVMNWINEFEKWITPDIGCFNIYNPTRLEKCLSRLEEIVKWRTNGGVCIINYELMRIVLEETEEKTGTASKFHECLRCPGPDLVICDEGHVLKNEETKLSKAMSRIRTKRRIVLTGTPMQNNLREYHCMVQFVKPNLLGTINEFVNMFVNPILNGQYENSLVEDVQLMKERSHILHKKLSGCVQRFDLSTLQTYLPEKHEYVISVALTESQVKMYRTYLKNYSVKRSGNRRTDGVALFADYQSLQRIWTHPYTLKLHATKHEGIKKTKPSKRKPKTKLSEEEDEDESDEAEIGRRVPLFWWVPFATVGHLEDARESNKLTLLLQILKECEEAEEKILVFSGSLYSLQLIQDFLKKVNDSEVENPSLCNMTSTWEQNLDYLVLTGSTSSEDRDDFCKRFNDLSDARLRLFLISTKAGGMGINLTGASRAVLFDVSWNPSHDIQSIFRIYRIGQKKPCFVYRLVASGSMEEKIYERQVAKQSISHRVVDEKQIARHYTEKELLELYLFEPNKKKLKSVEPKDPLLQKVFRQAADRIVAIHEHDTLLQHNVEEELAELEKKDAWTAHNTDDLENLPETDRTMLSRLKPQNFDPVSLRRVLNRKYPNATDEELSSMMSEFMPRIRSVLDRPDFIDVMKRQAFYLYARSLKSKRRKRAKQESREEDKRKIGTIDITETPESFSRISSANESSSENEDSFFVRKISDKKTQNRRRQRKPLKVWGARNGRDYGSPDLDSN